MVTSLKFAPNLYKGKISKVPIQKFKQIFCKFEGKFALEDQGLGY